MPYTKKYVRTSEGFDLLRGERRSFFCPNKLWEELLKHNEGICSVSEFIKQAIVEKLKKDDPERSNYYASLLCYG